MRGNENDSASSRTLATVLRAETLTIGDAVRIAVAVAEEVAGLHAAGRAHGSIGPDTVAIDGDAVSLTGPLASATGLAAPPALRDADLDGAGRVLAAALGWDDGPMPSPIERLLARAREADAPASALAQALVRLRQDPLTVAPLLPPAPVAADERLRGVGAFLGLLVPRSDRRTTGVAAGVLAGVAALGAVLLLAGTPGSTVAPPQAIEAAVVAPAPAESPEAVAAVPLPTSVGELLRPVQRHVLAPSAAPKRQGVAAAVEVAGPTAPSSPTTAPVATTAPPTGTPTTAAPSPSTSAPQVTAAPVPSAPPTTLPTAPTAPSAPPVTVAPSSAPAAPASTAPAPSAAATG